MYNDENYLDYLTDTENDALMSLFKNGIISADDVIKAIKKNVEELVIKKHKYKIYYSSNQRRWRT